ncbi:LamB/YcsF family protein [Saccharopolyspora sp. K220]|uniref:5-oxoprolinase subunit PxpA n=1 Tax=Saccharopolyspora soli TaxID=2926618 RepID=UPI001F56E96B|nr:5-oxoprolinase subunit PxpA [Saccharopolyspora soli]MCI2422318.1 LamB/YcsF family protein [Saccharopolyspora soli]
MTTRRIDLNSDLGESYGVYRYGNDDEMMPLITSANVACGFHAGDPRVLRDSVRLAARDGVRIGAHVGLPDPLGFGRRAMEISPDDAYSYTLYQLGALGGFLVAQGLSMSHVKPHGALYMSATRDQTIAHAIAAATVDYDRGLEVYALPGSAMASAAAERGLRVVPEYFADRPYQGADVTMFGWTPEDIGSAADAGARVAAMLADPVFADVRTVCVHSDTPGAPGIMSAVRKSLLDKGLSLGP